MLQHRPALSNQIPRICIHTPQSSLRVSACGPICQSVERGLPTVATMIGKLNVIANSAADGSHEGAPDDHHSLPA